ncbi:HD-GYP domain-containing protein [Desulfogranum japonicum]|uniref:HD-GYP domain-containing protein n=1 Tax=Desulfogranum japonicum TaxID=231447 RepID=UPI0003FD01D2|nr:HD domain-containing phosphohydrolase [Desulfogranum japonicum]
MHTITAPLQQQYAGDIKLLFYQRSLVCIWMAIIFFSLFSILDFICCRQLYSLFTGYRVMYVLTCLLMYTVLKHPAGKRYVHEIMYCMMLLGATVISLMAAALGGFVSNYYVGILLMIAGAFSVLPLNVVQSLVTGVSMYLVYMLIVMLYVDEPGELAMRYALNNSFFFLSMVGVTTVQCYDDLFTQIKALRAQKSLRRLRGKLVEQTDNLEETVQQRMAELEESELKFKDLYNNISDMVIVIDADGIIYQRNKFAAEMLAGKDEVLLGHNWVSFICAENRETIGTDIIERLKHKEVVTNVQLCMQSAETKEIIEAELSGQEVDIEQGRQLYQLIIRDISLNKEMERQVLESQRLIDSSRQNAILGLARLAEFRDDDTGSHLERIREYTKLLAQDLARGATLEETITPLFIEDLYKSSVLHDIGKVGIPDHILLKPGPLTDEEMALMRQHCEFGYQTLRWAEDRSGRGSFLHMGQEITRFHHERWDGSGYPKGLCRDDIPLSARIVALADVYDALTSSRPYKAAHSHEDARKYIIEQSGAHFDPQVVNAFVRLENQFKILRMNMLLS